ncbi:uncharacterized protein LOC122672342 [Telopea speciosissima]|uniref:uncharacterized protein LOC122672342 n=1 Tax=Telopea speciosissima TaxID=54955 RepID=UPI001CC6CA09|nr:uncharacterized protein LOC122672342 [Telopea speciosissima]
MAKVADFFMEGPWDLLATIAPVIHHVFNIIQSMDTPPSNNPDRRVWAHTNSGSFSVASAWEAIRSKAPPWEWDWAIWKNNLQPQTSVFGWRLMYGALPTDDKVQCRAVALASRCELYGVACDSGTHIFMNYSFSCDVWRDILLQFNESWTGFPTNQLLFLWWRKKLKLIPQPTIWGPLIVIACQ